MADTTAAGGEIDAIMERASEALVAMDYLTCERLCEQALGLARRADDFERYARILLPLQESRRQRRQIAEEHGTAVFAGPDVEEPGVILKHQPTGCILLLDPPYTADDAAAVRAAARDNEQMVEVLLLDQKALTAAFLKALEDRGDGLLASIPSGAAPIEKLDAIAARLHELGDHEIAHQQLAQAARQSTRVRPA